MKKRVITIMLALAFLISSSASAVFADTVPLNDKAVYYTDESDYIDGDCVLTATRMMIRRSAIMDNKTGWKEITNEILRPAATMDGLLMYSFSFAAEGNVYMIECGSFSGEGDEARIAEFEQLLEEHPEGIVVHGEFAASTGTHGVLVTDVVDGQVYVMDSSYNMGMFSEGIQRWEDSTMLEPSLVTDYWYISDVSAMDPDMPLVMKALESISCNVLKNAVMTVQKEIA